MRGIIPDVVTDQTPAHDVLSYVPAELTVEEAAELRRDDPAATLSGSLQSMGVHVAAILGLRSRGAVAFDYGNNLRQQATLAGIKNAYDYPGLCARLHSAAVLRGQGSVPLGGAFRRSGGYPGHG